MWQKSSAECNPALLETTCYFNVFADAVFEFPELPSMFQART